MTLNSLPIALISLDQLKPGVLFVLGVGVFGGVLGAMIFQRLRIPQVVGYIAIGLIIGQTGLELVSAEDVKALESLNRFALGIIGFLVGGELRAETFRKYGKQFAAILLGEGLGAFVLVGAPVTLFTYFLTHDLAASFAAGIVFGAIASATDPASTTEVLWEYRSAGVLTTALVAVVALDDALAMTLYGLGTSAAQMISGEQASIAVALQTVGLELFGAVALGLAAGLVLFAILRRVHQDEKALAIAIGTILLVIGIAAAFEMDVILAAMTLGVTLVNAAPRRSRELFHVVHSFATPIYVIFFVLVGARLSLGEMPGWLWAIVGIYVVGRSAGKMAGAWLGARVAGAETVVRQYAGLGLFAQGGVAVGLSIVASQRLDTVPLHGGLSLGQAIVYGVTATTLIVQIVGPPMVKLAVKLAGETGRNVTEADVVATMTVEDVMDREAPVFTEGDTIGAILKRISDTDAMTYPVVDDGRRLLGVITLGNLRKTFHDTGLNEWMVAFDLMEPAVETVGETTPLEEAMNRMREQYVDGLPVVREGGRLAGLVEMATAQRGISREVLKRSGGSGR